MAYKNRGALRLKEEMQLRPQTAHGPQTKGAMGSTKGDVGMSPRSSQGPGNHGSFAKSIAGRNGVTFKGDPVHNVGKDVPGGRRGSY